MRKLNYLFMLLSISAFAQELPLAVNNYEVLTSHKALSEFVQKLDKSSDLLNVTQLGSSVEGRELFSMYFSKAGFGEDKSKIKVLFFAQQHGNEHSGKEGALVLASNLVQDANKYLFDKIDLVIVPQMNPDGSEADRRFNSGGMDLNRNHLILSEPETIALHRLFNKYHFEVTLDVHEFFPYSRSFKEFGYYKSADEQFGMTSNLNVSPVIRKYSKEKVYPFLKAWDNERGYTMNEYLVGGPPEVERCRHSTVDINDGRQSLGVQNTLSFILEGKNGKESSADNIKRRAEGQAATMLGLLQYVYENAEEIKTMVHQEREKLNTLTDPVVIRMEHIGNGGSIEIPMSDAETGKDTVISLTRYEPIVQNLLEVPLPKGYLVNTSDTLLMKFLSDQDISYTSKDMNEEIPVEEITITQVDSMIMEETQLVDLKIEVEKKSSKEISGDYVFVPVNQMQRNIIVTGFEPQSMLGLVQYPRFSYLTKQGVYPIIRVP